MEYKVATVPKPVRDTTLRLKGKYAYRSGSDGPNDIFSLLNMSGCSPKKKNELGIFYEITTHCLGNHVTFH